MPYRKTVSRKSDKSKTNQGTRPKKTTRLRNRKKGGFLGLSMGNSSLKDKQKGNIRRQISSVCFRKSQRR